MTLSTAKPAEIQSPISCPVSQSPHTNLSHSPTTMPIPSLTYACTCHSWVTASRRNGMS